MWTESWPLPLAAYYFGWGGPGEVFWNGRGNGKRPFRGRLRVGRADPGLVTRPV